MRLQEKVGSKLDHNPVLLQPFGHQVAGQASMLSVDPTTVCKPLITREHHLYCTLPSQLRPFTPQYKGVLCVRLEEAEDGHLTLWGYSPSSANGSCCNGDDFKASSATIHAKEMQTEDRLIPEDDRFLQTLQLDWSSGASTPLSSDSDMDLPLAVDAEPVGLLSQPQSRCMVRVKQDGEYEVKAGSTMGNKFLITTDDECLPQAGKGLDSLKAVTTQPLNPWGLSLHTRLLDKMRKSQSSASGCPFLVLENVVARFTRPCILDLKVGSRLHGDGASQKKIASQSRKCNNTTSRTLGLRLCGMQVYQETTGAYKSLDKYYGRTLTDSTFYNVLQDFLHNGQRLRVELLSPVLSRLNSLLSCLQQLNSFRFYASSLLIIYDGLCPNIDYKPQSGQTLKTVSRNQSCEKLVVGDEAGQRFQISPNLSNKKNETGIARSPPCVDAKSSTDTLVSSLQQSTSTLVGSSSKCDTATSYKISVNGHAVSESPSLVDVRMIDFAHTTHSGFQDDIVYEGPHTDYIWGLQNLINLFSQLQAEKT